MPILKEEAENRYLANKVKTKKQMIQIVKILRTTMRAFTYKALNRLIQGSAADIKKAMVLLFEAGIVPHIQI